MSDNENQKPEDMSSDEERREIEEFNRKYHKFVEFTKKVGVKDECLCCGQSVNKILLGYRSQMPVVPVSTLGKYYPAYAGACTNCGFVSTFFAPVVDKKIQEDESSE